MDVDSADSRTTAADCGGFFSIWETVNIVGSPLLTGLFGALSLYECEPFSLDCSNTTGPCDVQAEMDEIERSLDSKALEEDKGSSTLGTIVRLDSSIPRPKTSFVPTWTFQDGPSIGLSPFPTPTARSNSAIYDFASPDKLLQLSEAECMAKMPEWRKMTPAGILDLAHRMWRIAHNYYQLHDFQSALIWYRRIIRLKKHKCARQLRPIDTVYACLNVIECLRHRGTYAEAETLHRGVHKKILALFPNDEVAIMSRVTQAFLLGDFGDFEEEESIRREILQIQLSKFGPTSRKGLEAMRTLGSCLTQRKAFSQSEHLICTALQLQSQIFGHRPPENDDLMDVFVQQIDLARVLNRSGKYLEAEKLLRYIGKVIPDLISIKDKRTFFYHFELAETLRIQGRFGESKKIYQDLLDHHGASLDPHNRAAIMQRLAIILEQSGRGSEAAALYKTSFDLRVEADGLEHKYPLQGCVDLGSCYVRQGLFDEAVSHYEQTISKIELLHKEGDNFLSENVEKMRGWIVEVNTDRCKANGFKYADREQFDEAILHLQHHIDKLVEIQMNHGMGPVHEAAAKGVKRVRRWISRMEMKQCKAVGFGLADKGLFIDAMLYFQQHIEMLTVTHIDIAAGDVGESSAKSIERIKRWISTVTMNRYKATGFDYASEGLFDEAIAHFHRAETELTEAQNPGSEIDPASNTKSIVRVRGWISSVVDQEMTKWKATGFGYVDQGLFDQAVLHYQQAMEKVSKAKLVDSSINVYYGCEERIQRWMSKAYALKSLGSCLEIGIGFADEGNFDKSLQHFQQAMDEIDMDQEYEIHYRTECIKVLQHHIQEVEKWRAESVEERASEPASGDSGQDVEME